MRGRDKISGGEIGGGDAPAEFDQRPGALGATRIEPASGILVCGMRSAPDVMPAGAWMVLCSVRGRDGLHCDVTLTAGEARALARELIDMADVIEGVRW